MGIDRIFYGIAVALIAKKSFDFFDYGLANILGLESLQHGTNLVNYIAIRFFGGDPNYGGQHLGSTVNNAKDDTKGFFYVFKDKEFSYLRQAEYNAKICPKYFDDLPEYYKKHPLEEIEETNKEKIRLPSYHAKLSTQNLVSYFFKKLKITF